MNYKKMILGGMIFWLAGSFRMALAEVEDWYTYWGFGFSNHTYEEPLDTVVRMGESLPGWNRVQTAYDLFGFYWPLQNQKTMAGFVVSGSADRLQGPWGGYIQINQYLYAGSMMHFFGKEIGDGFFVRGDLGLSKAVVDISGGNPVGSDSGSGVLLGVGYGIPVSKGSRILFSLTASNNNIQGHQYASTAFRIAGLW